MGQLGQSHGHGTRQGWIESKSCSFMHLMARKGLTKYTDFSERSPHLVADKLNRKTTNKRAVHVKCDD